VADTNTLGPLVGVHVLVVDDNDDARDILQRALRYAGSLVTAASSAREALASIAVADMIVTDMSMPGEDGLWLFAQAEQTPRRVPVIVVSGFGDYYNLSGTKFARLLLKPIEPWRLCVEVRAAWTTPDRLHPSLRGLAAGSAETRMGVVWVRPQHPRAAGALDLVAGAGSAVAGWRRRLHNARRAAGSSCGETLRAHRVMQGSRQD
jgi:CheY-like chemotaxis protein